MTKLNKFDVETLISEFDADPIEALSTALAKVLDQPGTPWPDLVRACSFNEIRCRDLLRGDERALDELAAELNELRTIQR